VVMANMLFFIPHPEKLTPTIGVAIFGGLVYLTLLTAIDREFRSLIVSIWLEIKNAIKGITSHYPKSKE
jgi:hypothetical protein